MEMPLVQTDGAHGQPAGPRQNDIQELTTIVADRLQYFLRIAMRYLDNSHDAEDAVQDAFLSAYRHLWQFRGQAQLSTWLTTIVINSARMKARGRLRQPHISIDGFDHEDDQYSFLDRISDSRPNPEDLFRERELRDNVDRLSSRLPPVLRETLKLRAIDELSIRETAAVLGVRESSVKPRTFRARARLRRMLQEDTKSSPNRKKHKSDTIERLHVEDTPLRRSFEKRRAVAASVEIG